MSHTPPALQASTPGAGLSEALSSGSAAARPLQIGTLIFDDVDQIDVTGPFEVLASLPGVVHRLYAPTSAPVRDMHGLMLMPNAPFKAAPTLDVLHIPGGAGQQRLMDDHEVLEWIRVQAFGAQHVLSVCTGALLLGAAGLLVGRRATTHWASQHLLAALGAETVDERVVVDGKYVFAAGVTAGIDGAFVLAAQVGGQDAAQAIQLRMQYAPEPPFQAGSPATAPAHIVEAALRGMADLTEARRRTVDQAATRLGILSR